MLEVDVAKEELADKKQLEASKLQLHGELKRKIALETMLNTLDVSLDIVNCVIFEVVLLKHFINRLSNSTWK